MKKFYGCLLSVLFGTIFGFCFVKGDIIDSTILTPEENEAWHVIDVTTKPENGDKVYGGDCINPVICFFSQDVGFDIVDFVRRIAVFLVCVLLLMIISVFPLYNIFEKLGEKGSKALIPIKNVYCLADLVKTKKIGVIWWLLAIFSFFLVKIWDYSTLNTCLQIFDIHGGYRGVNSNVTCGLHNICSVISSFPIIIIFLVFDCLIFISYYRLFRKFGWDKWYAVLGTIFFPIGACVLGFGDFERQGKILEKKEGNN